jgi:hypothetical protein
LSIFHSRSPNQRFVYCKFFSLPPPPPPLCRFPSIRDAERKDYTSESGEEDFGDDDFSDEDFDEDDLSDEEDFDEDDFSDEEDFEKLREDDTYAIDDVREDDAHAIERSLGNMQLSPAGPSASPVSFLIVLEQARRQAEADAEAACRSFQLLSKFLIQLVINYLAEQTTRPLPHHFVRSWADAKGVAEGCVRLSWNGKVSLRDFTCNTSLQW